MSLPIPAIDDYNKAFWTGGLEGSLLITQCGDCAKYVHPPTSHCAYCYSDNVGPAKVSGRGTVYSYTINRQAWQPDLDVPYVIAIVALDDQPDVRLMTNIVDCDPSDVAIGRSVEVEFQPRGNVSIPVFRLVEA